MITSLHLKVLFWLSVLAWALLLFVDGQPITSNLFKPSSMVLSGVVGIVTLFEKWGWRWKLLYPWFVKTPNLIGAYKGEITSYWIDPSTGSRAVIPAFLTIRQTLSSIHIRVYTSQSESSSILGTFVDSPDGKCELFYAYRSEPRLEVRSRNAIHYGGVRLAILRETESLEGTYWTDRQTIGEMTFTRFSRNTPQSYQENESLANSP